MKKLFMLRIVKFTALILPISIVCLFCQTYLFCPCNFNTDRIHDFYNEEKNSLDVVFIGASEVFTGYSPAYAYDKYGFTSYMYAIDSNPGSLYKSQLKEILSRQNPQLIFVEVDGFLHGDGRLTEDATLRMYTENIPISINKMDTIFHYQYEDKLSCVFPFIKYHSEWQDNEALHYRYTHRTAGYDELSLLKGMVTETLIDGQSPEYNPQNDQNTSSISDMAEACLIDFLEYCNNKQLDNIIFVRFPHKLLEYNYGSYCSANQVGHIVEQYGYEYLNLDQSAHKINIDYTNDFYNPEHLNIYGQMKLSDYLGNLIINGYHITPIKQTEKNAAHWEECGLYAHAYFSYVDSKIRNGVDQQIYEEPYIIRALSNILHDQGPLVG